MQSRYSAAVVQIVSRCHFDILRGQLTATQLSNSGPHPTCSNPKTLEPLLHLLQRMLLCGACRLIKAARMLDRDSEHTESLEVHPLGSRMTVEAYGINSIEQESSVLARIVSAALLSISNGTSTPERAAIQGSF